MAQVLPSQVTVHSAWKPWLLAVLIGAGAGLVYWTLTVLLSQFVVAPFACRDAVSGLCTNATHVSANIAAIIGLIAAIFVMIKVEVARPLIVAVATAAVLWDTSRWTEGLIWFEAIGWSVLLFALSYGLFAHIARAERLWVSLVISILIVAAVRIALVLY